MGKEIIIIGGGIGGLTVACLLSKEGYKTTVLEQHYKIGGGLHCFDRFGLTFESGIHYVSGFEETGVLRKIYSYLNILDRIEIMPLDKDGFDVIHIGSDGGKFKIGVGKENFIKILSEQFPGEAENIQKYIDEIYSMCNNIPLFNLETVEKLYSFDEKYLIPINEFIESFIKDKRLRNVLAWNGILYGGEKKLTPIYVYALVTKFYIEGASRFVGGSQAVADEMVKLIEAHGGKVLTSTEVTEIKIKDKLVQKLVTSDGREFKGDSYISGIHPSLMLEMLDTPAMTKAYRTRISELENTYSAFIVFIKLKENKFPFMNNNYYYFDDYNIIYDVLDYDHNSFPKGFMLSTPPSKNQGKYADKLLINCVMTIEDFKKWKDTTVGNRGDEYKKFKKKMETQVLDLAIKQFPELKDGIDKVFSGTPLTIRDYLKSKDGSMYGYKKDLNNIVKSQVLPRTKVKNLFLTGQNINLHGIIGVPLSAIVTAGEFVGINYLVDKINSEFKSVSQN